MFKIYVGSEKGHKAGVNDGRWIDLPFDNVTDVLEDVRKSCVSGCIEQGFKVYAVNGEGEAARRAFAHVPYSDMLLEEVNEFAKKLVDFDEDDVEVFEAVLEKYSVEDAVEIVANMEYDRTGCYDYEDVGHRYAENEGIDDWSDLSAYIEYDALGEHVVEGCWNDYVVTGDGEYIELWY